MKLLKAEAGVNDGKAGLLSAAGLFAKGGIFDKKSESFNIHELDPYLLFDAQSSMLGTLEAETLDLDPATPSTLDVITATRSSVATRTLPDGRIALAEQDTVRVDYTQGEQLTPTKYQNIGYTDFSSGWSNYNSSDASGDGYNGQPSRVVTADGNAAKYYISVSSVNAVVYTLSFYIRRISGSGTISGYHASASNGNQTDITVTSEWTRQQVTFTGDGGNISAGVRVVTSGDQVEISQPQVEEGTTASSFVANTTGSPKFISSAVYSDRVPMILVEPSSENLITQTDFSAGWSLRGSATVEQTTEPTPLPAQTALRLQSNGGISDRYQAPSGYPSGVSTASVYIKWDGVDTRFRIERAISNSRADFNVTQAGVTHYSNTADGYSIEEHGDGWWRVSNTMTNPTWVQLYADVEDGDGSILMALPQHEVGTVATSFIPTSGSAVTRAADDLVITGSAFTDFYNASEGTVYVESTGRGYFDNNTTFAFSDNSSANRIYARSTSNSGGLTVFSGGSVSASMGGLTVVANNVLSRSAHSFKANNFLTSRDGNSATPDTSGNMPVGMDRLYIGAGQTGGNQLNGHIKRLIYWPYHSDSL